MISKLKGLNWKFSNEPIDTPSPYRPDAWGSQLIEVIKDMATEPTLKELKQRFLETLKSGDMEASRIALEALRAKAQETQVIVRLAAQSAPTFPTREEVTKNLDFDMPEWDEIPVRDLL